MPVVDRAARGVEHTRPIRLHRGHAGCADDQPALGPLCCFKLSQTCLDRFRELLRLPVILVDFQLLSIDGLFAVNFLKVVLLAAQSEHLIAKLD